MKGNWTEINEIRRTYLMPNGEEVVIEEPRALFISSSRTHYLSNEDDKVRAIIPWPFYGIIIEVAESENWVYPPPRFNDFDVTDPQELQKSINRILKGGYLSQTGINGGPWAVSDLFENGK